MPGAATRGARDLFLSPWLGPIYPVNMAFLIGGLVHEILPLSAPQCGILCADSCIACHNVFDFQAVFHEHIMMGCVHFQM